MSLLPGWLGSLGLAQYLDVFIKNDIDLGVLPSLTEQDLTELGVSMRQRKKLLAAVVELSGHAGDARPPAPANSSDLAAPPWSSSVSGERRQLTVLFCDMVGFTALASGLDPETLQKIVSCYEDACAVCITPYDGYVFQRLGDGIVAFFGYSLAHEGEAERAIHAGLAIIEKLARLEIPEVGRLSVRIGIATGVVVVSSLEKGAFGETMNLASRLQAIASVDSIVVSESVRRLAAGAFLYEDLGSQRLKGIDRPTPAYRILGASFVSSRFEAATQRGLTEMVGREHEIALLLDRWQRAQEGEGQVVLLSGEPGIGKSRVLNALRERLEHQGAKAQRFQCSPYYTTAAFYPSINNLERALRFSRDEATESKIDKLESLLVRYFGRPREDLPYIAALLSIPFEARYGAANTSPQRFKADTLRCLVDLSEAASRKHPTVMLFEDAHWADPSTLEVLDLLVDRVKSFPLLIVLTHRPEFQSRWLGHGHVAALNLSKLTRRQSGAIVSKLTEGKALPGALFEQIVAKTDGVPLYVEELTKSILESDDLQDVGDHYEYAGVSRDVSVPASLRDSLMSRLDRYAPVKEIAQIGAVIGREFSYELMLALAPKSQADLDQALAQLTESGLATRRGVPPEAIYTFKHALIQDAAYDSLLKTRRQELHGKIARVLEERFPVTKEVEPELLAQHYAAADMPEPAMDYALKAAKRASDRSAYVEALALLDAATAMVQRLPEGGQRMRAQLRIELQRAMCFSATNGFPSEKSGAAWKMAWRLADQCGDSTEHFPALSGLFMHHLTRGELREAETTAREMLRHATLTGEPAFAATAGRQLGAVTFARGLLRESSEHFASALRLYDPSRDGSTHLTTGFDIKVSSLANRSLSLHLLGHPDQALALNGAALQQAEALGHHLVVAGVLYWVQVLSVWRREASRLLQQAEMALAMSQRYAFSVWIDTATLMRGIALMELGDAEQGVGLMRLAVIDHNMSGMRWHRPFALAMLAVAEARCRHWDAAEARFDECLREVETTDERWFEAEIYRLQGEFFLARDGQAGEVEALRCFERSLPIARDQGAKAWELRTSTSLAKLWHRSGQTVRARELLMPIHQSFNEGLDTADLLDASTLLNKLRLR